MKAQSYAERRAKFAQLTKQTLIIISGNDHIQSSSDATYKFIQDGYFLYLTGIEESGWRLVIDKSKGYQFLFNIAPSGYHDEVWEGRLSHKDIKNTTGKIDIKSELEAWAYIKKNCKTSKSIGTLTYKNRFNKDFGMFINPSKIALTDRVKKTCRALELFDVGSEIRLIRSVKDSAEVVDIKQASYITKAGFDLVSSHLSVYTTESEILADFAKVFLSMGSDFAYDPIIASGANATKLHYVANSSVLAKNSLLLCDVAASYNQYKADVTRSLFVGTPNVRQKAIYDAISGIQAKSLGFLKAGITMREHELYVEKLIGVALNELGVIKSSRREDIRKYYPHGVSHHLGIDVHDSCDYEEPLPEGAVITVEPGIYLPEEGIGVRIEDDVLITKDGVNVLSKDIDK